MVTLHWLRSAKRLLSLALLLAVGGYGIYTWAVYKKLRVPFWRMRLLSAARPDGAAEDILKAVEALKALGRGTALDDDAPAAPWSPLPQGSSSTPVKEWVYADEDLRVGLSEADGTPRVFARLPAAADLAALLGALQSDTAIVENIGSRLQWQEVQDSGRSTLGDVEGTWQFCFRDYVNAEELSAMAANRGAFAPFRICGGTKLAIGPGGAQSGACATLRDRFVLLGLIPLQIEWRGSLVTSGDSGQKLSWTDTELRLGWKRLGKTVSRPPAAEKLRQQDWEVLPKLSDSKAPPVLVLYRKGVGTLIFRKLGR